MYALSTTSKVVGDSENPQTRKSAPEGAATIDKNGWRVWIEHHKTGARIFESDREKAHRESAAASN